MLPIRNRAAVQMSSIRMTVLGRVDGMKTRTGLVIAASVAALALGACDGGVSAPPSSSPGPTVPLGPAVTSGPTATPTHIAPSAAAGSVDCAALETSIVNEMRAVASGTIEVSVGSTACADGTTWTASLFEDTFEVTITASAAMAAVDLADVVDAAAAVWADPDVQAVAPNAPQLYVETGSLGMRLRDGFPPLDPAVADGLAVLAAETTSGFTYSFVTEVASATIEGIPFGVAPLWSFVQVRASGSLDDLDLQSTLDTVWPSVTDVAIAAGVAAYVSLPRGDYSSTRVTLDPAADLPADLVQFGLDLEALAANAEALSASTHASNTDLTVHLIVNDWYAGLDSVDQAEADRLVTVAQAWTPGTVDLSVTGPIE